MSKNENFKIELIKGENSTAVIYESACSTKFLMTNLARLLVTNRDLIPAFELALDIVKTYDSGCEVCPQKSTCEEYQKGEQCASQMKEILTPNPG